MNELSKRETALTEPLTDDREFAPATDVEIGADEYTLRLDMPGVDPKDIDVSCENGTLSIHGRASRRQPENTAYFLQEYEVGNYACSFQLGEDVDAGRIVADYRDGVLTVTLPKAERARPRRIQVRTA